ncbi:MAG: hypothetical protein ACKOUS_02035 [Alphaproteobacteria bacterium]
MRPHGGSVDGRGAGKVEASLLGDAPHGDLRDREQVPIVGIHAQRAARREERGGQIGTAPCLRGDHRDARSLRIAEFAVEQDARIEEDDRKQVVELVRKQPRGEAEACMPIGLDPRDLEGAFVARRTLVARAHRPPCPGLRSRAQGSLRVRAAIMSRPRKKLRVTIASNQRDIATGPHPQLKREVRSS